MSEALIQLSPTQLTAYEALSWSLRSQPMLCTPIGEYPATAIVIALIDLEKHFGIDLDVDEALACHSVGGLLALVEAKVAPTGAIRRGANVEVYDFAAIRAAIGKPIRAEHFAGPINHTPVEAPFHTSDLVETASVFEAWGPGPEFRRLRPLSPATVARLAAAIAPSRSSVANDGSASDADFVWEAEFSVVGGPDCLVGESVKVDPAPTEADPPAKRPRSLLRRLSVFFLQMFAIGFVAKAIALLHAAAFGWPT